MTAQIHDSVSYRGCTYAMAGINGRGLFDPADHGVKPEGTCSACWRGFYCTYLVAAHQLYLQDLFLDLSGKDAESLAEGKGPKLFGHAPSETEKRWPEFEITGMREPIEYTGGLLLAANFIEKMYVHMGFHPAHKYREVHELIFEKGVLMHEEDCSAQMAKIRERIAAMPLEPDGDEGQREIMDWIEDCFRRDYTR